MLKLGPRALQRGDRATRPSCRSTRCSTSARRRARRSPSRSRSATRASPRSRTSWPTTRPSIRSTPSPTACATRRSQMGLDALPERHRRVLELRYGLDGARPAHARRDRPRVRPHPRAHPPDRGRGAARARGHPRDPGPQGRTDRLAPRPAEPVDAKRHEGARTPGRPRRLPASGRRGPAGMATTATDLRALARASYDAYAAGNRPALERLLADDLTFSSGPDPLLDRRASSSAAGRGTRTSRRSRCSAWCRPATRSSSPTRRPARTDALPQHRGADLPRRADRPPGGLLRLGPAARELSRRADARRATRGARWGPRAPLVVFRPGLVGARPVGCPGLKGRRSRGDRRRPR